MMEDKYDDTFLAKWLNGTISEEEKARFESTEAYDDYVKIIEVSSQLEAPSFDKQSLLSKIHDKKETKTRKLVPSWMYAAAAILASSRIYLCIHTSRRNT